MTDIFREVEEDIRRERLKSLWVSLGPFIIGAAALIVIGVGGWRGWEWYQERRSAEIGARYESALELARAGKHKEADDALSQIAAEAPVGYSALARFRAAAEQTALDPAKGIEAFDKLSHDISLPTNLRDLAQVRAAYILIDVGNRDEVAKRVEGLAKPENPWRHAAREAMTLASWKAGDEEAARKWAEDLISDYEAPGGTRTRAQLVLDLVGEPVPSTGSLAPAQEQKPAEVPVVQENTGR